MQVEAILERIFEIFINEKLTFAVVDVTPKSGIERMRPDRRELFELSFSPNSELGARWRRHLKINELSFGTGWQLALAFAEFLKGRLDDDREKPSMLGGL